MYNEIKRLGILFVLLLGICFYFFSCKNNSNQANPDSDDISLHCNYLFLGDDSVSLQDIECKDSIK